MTDTEAADKPATAAVTALTTAQLAFYAGWTMAVLYTEDPLQEQDGQQEQEGQPPKLPTVHELSVPDRRVVELGRLQRLLDGLAQLPRSSEIKAKADQVKPDDSEFPDRLSELHLTVLGVLAAAGLELQLAYELGRSLRDTVNPPAADLPGQLARGRIARLQESLATLSAEFPPQVTAIVSASLGRWSDFADVAAGSSAASYQHMRNDLLRQGDVWLMLLVGARSTAGLLTPEGYVCAGEAALRRSARIVRSVLVHHWLAVACIASALGGVLYLAISQLGGASQVWTSIAAIGSTLGISAQSVKSAISRLSTEAERPVFTAAEEDAKAWAVTTLPKADLSLRQKRKLRKSGIAKPVGLGRF